MKVVLLYAPYPGQRFADEEQTISPVRTRNPKSALATLVAGTREILARRGIEADFQIIDTQVDGGAPVKYAEFAYGPRTLECFRYGGAFESYDDAVADADIIGISNNFANSSRVVTDFARHLRALNPTAWLVGGGMDMTARPDWYLERGRFDIVVQLEGEESFAEIITARARGVELAEPLKVRPGQCGGCVVLAGPQVNMSELPPMAIDLVRNPEQYDDTGEGTPPPTVRPPYTCIETSRGCYRTCSFCATPMRGHYRYMSPSGVRRHLEFYRSQGISNLLFQEDNVLSRIQRSGRGTLLHDSGREDVIDIFRAARALGFSWEFANGLEIGKFLDLGVVDEELMDAVFWNDASDGRWQGCYRVQLSLEYLGEDPKRKFNKLRPFQEQKQIVSTMLERGVRYQTFNVLIGHDEDDRDRINLYLERCLELKEEIYRVAPEGVPYFNVFNRTLLPGTADFRTHAHRLEFDIDQTPEVISVYLSPMSSDHLSYYELFQERIRLNEAINGSLIDQYDGIYRAPVRTVDAL